MSIVDWFLPFTLKRYLSAEEELWKLKYFTMQKYINLQKKKSSKKETKIVQDIIRTHSITDLTSFNTSQNIIFQKSSYKNKPIIIIIIT
jgi:hypothetical protein